jgi:EAL domain-containing protein (putative c-di-GMP-specific phosphodiesterase class I)
MAVNISARSLQRASNLPDTVAELTEIWSTTPDRLTLELTEDALSEAEAPEILGRLHKMGEKMSIDDFGTGFSSLAHLHRLQVDELKIDRSFMAQLASASDDEVIVRSTIDLAHNLGLTVVAEGVESEHVLKLLSQRDCDAAQGYFFHRPCAADEFTRWMAQSPYGAQM